MVKFIWRMGKIGKRRWNSNVFIFFLFFFFSPSGCFRQLLGNGTLYFPPFLAQDFRAEVHNARYRCRATSSVGTVLSREVTLRAGEFLVAPFVSIQYRLIELP